MKRINQNDFAREIAAAEGKKQEVNIAQIKEVMRLVFRELAIEAFGHGNASGVMDLLERHDK